MCPSNGNQTSLDQLVDEIQSIEDFDERGELLIEFAERFQDPPQQIASRPYPDSHKVPGCESDVYVWLRMEGQGAALYFAVENPQGVSAKAMAVILQECLNGKSIECFNEIPTDLAYRIFGSNLSMGKAAGLSNMVRIIHELVR